MEAIKLELRFKDGQGGLVSNLPSEFVEQFQDKTPIIELSSGIFLISTHHLNLLTAKIQMMARN